MILKPCNYLIDDGDENEKKKRSKKMCHKTKPNTLLDLIEHKCDDTYDVIDKIYLYVKDPN